MVIIIPNDKFIFGCDFSEFKFQVFLYPFSKSQEPRPPTVNSKFSRNVSKLDIIIKRSTIHTYMYIHSSSLFFSDKVPYNILHRFTDYRIYNRV